MGKQSACNAGDVVSAPRLERSPGGGMAAHSTILAWRILCTEEPGCCSPWYHKELVTTEHACTHMNSACTDLFLIVLIIAFISLKCISISPVYLLSLVSSCLSPRII